jgi:hypothetical protein
MRTPSKDYLRINRSWIVPSQDIINRIIQDKSIRATTAKQPVEVQNEFDRLLAEGRLGRTSLHTFRKKENTKGSRGFNFVVSCAGPLRIHANFLAFGD